MGNRHNDDYDNIVHRNERSAQRRRSLRRNGTFSSGRGSAYRLDQQDRQDDRALKADRQVLIEIKGEVMA